MQFNNPALTKKTKYDNSTLKKINRLVAFAACFLSHSARVRLFALSPAAKAFGVSPPPDGGYPNQNTAEGDSALFSLTTGSDNTANGFQALYSNTGGNSNTANGSCCAL